MISSRGESEATRQWAFGGLTLADPDGGASLSGKGGSSLEEAPESKDES